MQTCANCEKRLASSSVSFMDYCARCAKNLCGDCMKNGCCGKVPARSGKQFDCDDEAIEIEPYNAPRTAVSGIPDARDPVKSTRTMR